MNSTKHNTDETRGAISGPSEKEMAAVTRNMQQNPHYSNRHHAQNHQGEKIQNLKSQIEKQMKAYAKQEEYEEMLKLIKVSRRMSLAW